MKTSALLATLLAALFLTACGEKAPEAPVEAAPAAEVAPAADAAAPTVEAAPAAAETGGGYVPTAEELIPGETRPVEAAPAAPAADAAPVEAAPAEAAPAN